MIVDQYGKLFNSRSGADINNLHPAALCRHAYFGSHGFRDGNYLVPHRREVSFDERRKYSAYVNYFDRLVNALTKPVYNEVPQREWTSSNPYWDDSGALGFLHDCDRTGMSLTRFLSETLLRGKMQGVSFVVMDSFPEGFMSSAASQKAALEARVYPYVYRRSVESVHSAQVDDAGALSQIVFREPGPVVEGKATRQYRMWDRFQWAIFSDDKLEKQTLQGEHGLGTLPVIPVTLGKVDELEDPVIPAPPLYDIARTNWELYNVSSELREVERKQGFSILTYPRTADQSDKTKTVGTSNALSFDGNSSHAPAFISPDVQIPKMLMEHMSKLIATMFEQASLAGVVGVQSAASGISKEWDFQATRESLRDTSRIMEEVEYKIANVFERYTQKPINLSVKYSDNYGVTDMMSEIDRSRAMIDLGLGPKAEAQVKKFAFNAWAKDKDDITSDVIDSVIQDIESRSSDASYSERDDRKKAEEALEDEVVL